METRAERLAELRDKVKQTMSKFVQCEAFWKSLALILSLEKVTSADSQLVLQKAIELAHKQKKEQVHVDSVMTARSEHKEPDDGYQYNTAAPASYVPGAARPVAWWCRRMQIAGPGFGETQDILREEQEDLEDAIGNFLDATQDIRMTFYNHDFLLNEHCRYAERHFQTTLKEMSIGRAWEEARHCLGTDPHAV